MSTNTAENRNHANIDGTAIVWWLNGENAPKELDEATIEHLENMILAGNREGELLVSGPNDGPDHRGWWELDFSPKTVTAEEAVKDIVEVLLESDSLLVTIYNQLCNGKLEYKGDSVFELTPD
jgi:hypothetical protein